MNKRTGLLIGLQFVLIGKAGTIRETSKKEETVTGKEIKAEGFSWLYDQPTVFAVFWLN